MPRIDWPGFVGPSNRLASVNADSERLINWFQEATAPGTGKNREWLMPRPGTYPDIVLNAGPVRALFYQDGRGFAVGGTDLYEIYETQTARYAGFMGPVDGVNATISTNGTAGHQLFVTNAGTGFIYDLITNTLTGIGSPNFLTPTSMGAFCDGYFLSLQRNSRTWQFSALEDGTAWSALDVNQVSTSSDNILALVVVNRDIWLFGSKTYQVWTNVGDPNTPFQPLPGSLRQMGIVGEFAWAVLDNAPFWVGLNSDGIAMVFRASGYAPLRVSDHAVEYWLSTFPRLDDLIGWTAQLRGHALFFLYEPTADSTWAYDVATNAWSEWRTWNPTAMRWEPFRSRCHTFAFSKHLVGSPFSSTIAEMDFRFYSDAVAVRIP